MRLIDADAMHKFVEDKVAEGKDGWANGVGYEWAWALTAVDMQPTIDPESLRPKGEWVKPYINFYGHPCHCCSLCGFKASYQDKNFCPDCGADMRGEDT